MDEPSKAVTHIQKTAQAPPADTAATTPVKFPIPTRVAVDTINVCKDERLLFSPLSFLLLAVSTFTISGNKRIGRNLVFIVNTIPAGNNNRIRSEIPKLPPPGSGI